MSNNQQTKYQRGKIYKLVCNHCGEFYVGSTTEPYLSRRLSSHKSVAKKNGSVKLYAHFIQFGWDQASITLLESFACDNNDELRAKEELWLQQLQPSLNAKKAFATIDDRKEWIKSYIQLPERKDSLQQYYNRVIETKQYYCQACNYTALNLSHLKMHQKTNKHNAKVSPQPSDSIEEFRLVVPNVLPF